MRTKYGEFQEHHTPFDQLGTVVTPQGLNGGYTALRRSLEAIEKNGYSVTQTSRKLQMGKRNPYPPLSQRNSGRDAQLMMDVLTWADRNHDLVDIAEKLGIPVWEPYPVTECLIQRNLITLSKGSQHLQL